MNHSSVGTGIRSPGSWSPGPRNLGQVVDPGLTSRVLTDELRVVGDDEAVTVGVGRLRSRLEVLQHAVVELALIQEEHRVGRETRDRDHRNTLEVESLVAPVERHLVYPAS